MYSQSKQVDIALQLEKKEDKKKKNQLSAKYFVLYYVTGIHKMSNGALLHMIASCSWSSKHG